MITTATAKALTRLREINYAFSATREYKSSSGQVRHKCFISYHAEDAIEVLAFVDKYDDVFIPKCLGVSDDEPWINSDNTDYIMDRIREKYLSDSTVTITLVGACTRARKYVDWETYSSLRRGSVNRLNGLMAIELPSVAGSSALPARVGDNVVRDTKNNDIGYARYYAYPTSKETLRYWIEDAFLARSSRDGLRDNSRARMKNNLAC